ncbi:MAG: two pore domain potassium channel family protein [Lachnospiraceae bacterium]|nr:two pore domain potassium channel family protein [Lachnospiraceae bacterium]
MSTRTPESKKTLLTVINAFVTAATLFLCMQCMSEIFDDKDASILFGVLYFTLGASYFLRSGLRRTDAQKKTALFYKISAFIFVICGISFMAFGLNNDTILFGGTIYFVFIIINRILVMVKAKKYRIIKITWGVILIIVMAVLYILLLTTCVADTSELKDVTPVLLRLAQASIITIPIMLRALGHIIALSFLRINIAALKKIIQKTFAVEILFGLLMLIIAFSFILRLFDPGFDGRSYGDALWYCFAIVTTIGFGDITATSTVGRILSVILGIYGIIVVALITSIIVNFYSEVKSDPDDEPETEDEDDELLT